MRLILFDIDGTLLRTGGAGTRALNRTMKEVFGVDDGMNGIRPDGKTDRQIVREALLKNSSLKFDESPMDEFFARYPIHFQSEMDRDSGLLVFWGGYHLLQRLSAEPGCLLGVATGNIEACARIKLERAGVGSFFSFGGYGSDAEDRTEMIRTAIRRGVEKRPEVRETVVIGDTPSDIRHGRNAGAKTVGVATGRYSMSELESQQPDLVVESLEPKAELMRFLAGK